MPAPLPRSPRRVGRPAQINRQAIAEAAQEVGLANLTLKAVADHLGVSVAGLYHHIRGKDDLLQLAAEASPPEADVPLDHGQHWAVWLAEWAVTNYQGFVAEPALVDQFLSGAINPEAIAGTTDAILGHLVDQGFTIREAHAAYQLTSSCALGAALKAIREARVAGRGAVGAGGAVAGARPARARRHAPPAPVDGDDAGRPAAPSRRR